MKVKDIVVREIEKIKPDASVFEAVEIMLEKGIRALIVEPQNERDTYGVITVRDIVFKAVAKGLELDDIKVAEIASKPLVCIDGSWEIMHAAELMANLNLARLAVTEGGEIIGMVSLMDIMKVYHCCPHVLKLS